MFDNSTSDAKFFIDGAYNFSDRSWRSGGEVIEESDWVQSEDFTYPILLDRIAYVKRKASSRYGLTKPVKPVGIDTKYRKVRQVKSKVICHNNVLSMISLRN